MPLSFVRAGAPRVAFIAVLSLSTLACSSTTEETPISDGSVRGPDNDVAIVPLDALAPGELPAPGTFCALPGSLVAVPEGEVAIVRSGDAGGPDESTMPSPDWLTVPDGFCAHYFGNVPHNRQLRFAPDGDLFAASPSAGTAGGSATVPADGGILVLPDDDHDGFADSSKMFAPVGSVQGLMFADGSLYFQNGTAIDVIPFAAGERTLPASLDGGAYPVYFDLANAVTQNSNHWPKNFDFAQDGTFYVTNGSDQEQECLSTDPVYGSIWKTSSLNPGATPSEVAKGFRNPIALKCEANHNVCLAVELSLDGSGSQGGREKIVPVREGDDWGFPCCATQYLPFSGAEYQDNGQVVTAQDCANVSAENVSLEIGNTPFGLDFEPGRWPAPWTSRAFVPLHGDVGSWVGSRVVAIELDPSSGLPLPASNLDGGGGDSLLTFAAGWDDGTLSHGRATSIAFAPDGRLFIGNDWTGDVYWFAPVNLPATWPGQSGDGGSGEAGADAGAADGTVTDSSSD